MDGNATGFKNIDELIRRGKQLLTVSSDKPYEFPPTEDATTVCAFLNFSSGTTGLPKAVRFQSSGDVETLTDITGQNLARKHDRSMPPDSTSFSSGTVFGSLLGRSTLLSQLV